MTKMKKKKRKKKKNEKRSEILSIINELVINELARVAHFEVRDT